jgi:hypothetical protein
VKLKISIKRHLLAFGVAVLICVLIVGFYGCKKRVIPPSQITVSNECGVTIDVYMDGVYQFLIFDGFTKTIKDIEWGTYTLEAWWNGTGELIDSEEFDIRFSEEFLWHIWSSAHIQVTNNYGVTLSIYGDDVHVGDLEDQEISFMENVPFGDHQLEARLEDGTVVETNTVTVDKQVTYVWKIEKN